MQSHIAIIEMKLLSETSFGGNNEQRSMVDLDVKTDEYGIPYYSGRTLKGVLREHAEWYVSCLPNEKKEIFQEALFRLFGKPDQKEKGIHYENYQALRFGDARLSDEISNFVKEKQLHPREVLQALTNVRTMTSIDYETGVAKDGSLRQIRVIQPNYIFYAPLFITRGLSAEEKELIEIAVKLLRNIGMMRNRGKGEVACSIHWNEEVLKQKENYKNNSTSLEISNTNKHSYIMLQIEVQEPLKISHVLGTSDSSYALHYIPGYVIRGALIHEYLNRQNLSSEELDTETIFNPELIQFWNGYLMIDGKRSLPFPQHLFETKEDSKKTKEVREVYNSLNLEKFRTISSKSPVKVSRHVMVMNDNAIKGKNVDISSSLHISINGKKSNPNKTEMYRYESITPNQTFQAVVFSSIETPFTAWLKQQQELTLWLGGARNSGYGRCHVKITVKEEFSEGYQIESTNEISEELYILATSDWILHNEHGQLESAIPLSWLEKQLGVKLKLENQVIHTQISGGYISLWKAYQPMIRAVQAGSIYRYKIIEGSIQPENIKKLITNGVGARRNEGFGRLIVLPHWNIHNLIDVTSENSDIAWTNKKMPLYVGQLKQFKEAILKNRLEKEVQIQAQEWYQSLTGIYAISKTQWGKLLQVSSELLTMDVSEKDLYEHYKKRWNEFWEDVQNRQNNKENLGYEGVRVHNEKMALKEFTMKILEKKWLESEIEEFNATICHPFWSMKAYQLLIRQIIRQFNEKGGKIAND